MPDNPGMATRRFYVDPTHPAVRKARQTDDTALSVTSLLTFPIVDHAGDYVEPAGCDFTLHAADPGVDIEHTGRIVAYARKSLNKPGAPYSQTWGDFEIDGQTHRLPVGTSYFDASDRVSSQVYQLVKSDALPGVSLEFLPVDGFAKSFGYRSPVDTHRDATRFLKSRVVRWTHCARPVNAGALVTKSFKQVPEALAKVLRDNRVGSEMLDPVIRKAFATYELPRTTIRVEKAMGDETVYDAGQPVEPAPVDQPAEDDKPAIGGVATCYALVQEILDAIARHEEGMQASDSETLRAKGEKWRDKLSTIVEEIKGHTDAHDAKLNGSKSDESTEDESTPDVDMSTDDDGMMKALRPVYRPTRNAVRVKRFTAAEAATAVQKAKDERPETPEEVLERIRKEDPAGYRKIQRALARRDEYPAVA